MTEIRHYNEDNESEIAEVLVGRRIVKAELGEVGIPGGTSYRSKAEGLLVLDDGTELYLTGNDGGCACSAGCYPLEKVATVDNVITRARVESSPDDYYGGGEGAYRIFVFADNQEINVAEFVGSDGNGYYGTGFELTVVRSQETS